MVRQAHHEGEATSILPKFLILSLSKDEGHRCGGRLA
jgi:hypothetical protein